MLEQRGQPVILAVKRSAPLFYTGVPRRRQPRPDAIAGSKGPREHRWEWTDLLRLGWPGRRHALLVRERRKPNACGEYEHAYDVVVFAPRTATRKEVVRGAGTRWAIEQGFEAAKKGVGLDQYEVRQCGWYRDITLALCAHAVLAAVRAHATPRAAKRGTARARFSVRPVLVALAAAPPDTRTGSPLPVPPATKRSATVVQACVAADGLRVVERAVA